MCFLLKLHLLHKNHTKFLHKNRVTFCVNLKFPLASLVFLETAPFTKQLFVLFSQLGKMKLWLSQEKKYFVSFVF